MFKYELSSSRISEYAKKNMYEDGFYSMNPNNMSGPQVPAPKSNAVMAFLQVKRTIPTWVIILGIVLAIGLGHATDGSASAANTANNTTTGPTTQTTTSSPTKTAPKPTATSVPKLTTIVSYSGSGQKNTANFHVNASQWQISWACQPGSFGGNFSVEVDNADGSTFDPLAVNEICDSSKHDITIERGSGDFFLKIDADTPWQIQIQAIQ